MRMRKADRAIFEKGSNPDENEGYLLGVKAAKEGKSRREMMEALEHSNWDKKYKENVLRGFDDQQERESR